MFPREAQEVLAPHTTPDSDQLPRHTTPDEVQDTMQMSPQTQTTTPGATLEPSKAPVPSPKYLPPQSQVGLLMSRPKSTESGATWDYFNTPAANPLFMHKWNSKDDYVKAIGAVETPLSQGEFRRATLTAPSEFGSSKPVNASLSYFNLSWETGDDMYSAPSDVEDNNRTMASDPESEAEENSLMFRSSAQTPNTSASSSNLLASPTPKTRRPQTSALEQLRILQTELKRLMATDHETEQLHLKHLMAIANTLGRDEALSETSKALRSRAAAKFTTGRAERLILEREADTVFRLTSVEPVRVVEARVDALQAERRRTREAVTTALDGLFERACEILDGSLPGVPAGPRVVGATAPSYGPAAPASRWRP